MWCFAWCLHCLPWMAFASFVSRDRRLPPEMSCDKLEKATVSWRRFRTLFQRFVWGALGEKQREALVQDAYFLLRNASWHRFRTNYIHVLTYLSRGQDGFPKEICLFGEVAAFQVLAVQTGKWQAWHETLVLQVEYSSWMGRDSGWPLWTATELGLRGVAKPLPPNVDFPMDYQAVFGVRPPAKFGSTPLASATAKRPSLLRVAIVGGHSSQLLQTGAMLQELILPRLMQLTYFGCIYAIPVCETLGSDPKSKLAEALLHGIKEDIKGGLLADGVPSHDLVLVLDVGASLILRQLSEDLPILHVIGIYPFTRLAENIFEELQVSVQHPKSYAVATSVVCAVQLAWMTGFRLPVISPLPHPKILYNPNATASFRRSLLQWRGDVLWNTIAARVFIVWLGLLFHRSAAMDIFNMTGPMSWEEVSQHHAVLFVPEDLTKIAFWDLYAAGMPIFVPDTKFLSMLLCFEEKSLEKMHYFDNNARHPFVKTGHFEDLEPFNLKTHCARKLELWAPLADYYQFPHVLVFSSSLELLEWMQNTDLESVSAAMVRFRCGRQAVAQRRFAAAVAQVFDVNASL